MLLSSRRNTKCLTRLLVKLQNLPSKQCALEISLKRFGEEHPDRALSYYSLGTTQLLSGDVLSGGQSIQRFFDIMIKRFGEEHPGGALDYFSFGATKQDSENVLAAFQSLRRVST